MKSKALFLEEAKTVDLVKSFMMAIFKVFFRNSFIFSEQDFRCLGSIYFTNDLSKYFVEQFQHLSEFFFKGFWDIVIYQNMTIFCTLYLGTRYDVLVAETVKLCLLCD